MSVFRTILTQLFNTGNKKRLPNDYQEVEYIQSDGNQYIDTGISGGNIGEYEIKFNPLGSQAHSYEQYFAGSRYADSYAGKIYCANGFIAYQGYPSGGDLRLMNMSNTILDCKVTVLDGIVANGDVKESYAGSSWGPVTFWVFNAHEESSLGASMKLYSLTMYTDGNKVREFVPCYRKSDNKIGLYDLVSKTFFTNSGSGTFVAGPVVLYWPEDYQEVKYIQSTGTQYIDTGVSCAGGIKCIYKANYQGYGYLCGAHNTSSPYGRCGANVLSNGSWELGYGDTYPSSGTFSLNTDYEVEYQTVPTDPYLKVQGGIYNDWTTILSNLGSQTVSTLNALVFTQQYSIAWGEPKTQAKLYSLKIYNSSGELVRDFVPCYSKIDYTAGLYDKVEGKFYTDVNNNNFVVGPIKCHLPVEYQQVDYISCSGSQYIDTGFKPNGQTGVEISMSNVTTNAVLFGAYNSTWTDGYGMYCNAYNWNNFYYHYYSNTLISLTPPADFILRFEKGSTIINGVLQASISEKTFTVNHNLYLLAGNWAGSRAEQPTTCKLKDAKIWDNGVLIHEYVPCYRKADGVIGLYDIIQREFKTNAGSGSFSKGGDV